MILTFRNSSKGPGRSGTERPACRTAKRDAMGSLIRLVPVGDRDLNPEDFILTAAALGSGGDITTIRLFTVRPALISDVGLRDIISLLDRRVNEISITSQVNRAWVRVISRTAGVEIVGATTSAIRDILNRQVIESMSFEMRRDLTILIGSAVLDNQGRDWDIVGVDLDDDRRNMIVRVERTADHVVVDSPYGGFPVPIRYDNNRS